MNWVQFSRWWGAGILTLIAVPLLLRMVHAIRAGRFGVGHTDPKAMASSIIGLTMVTIFFYGWFRYPDAPLHACGGAMGFCGKQGQPHSLAEYRAFMVWQTSLLIIWPSGMMASFLLNRKGSIQKADVGNVA